MLKELEQRGLPGTLAWLKQRYAARAPGILAVRLERHAQALFGRPLSQPTAQKLGADLTEGLTRAVSKFLTSRQAELIAALRDPAQGVTLVFTFPVERGELHLDAHVHIHPGWHHGRV